MSEATSIVGTVGAWVGGFVVLHLSTLIAYRVGHITTPSDRVRDKILREHTNELKLIRQATEAGAAALLRVEQIAIEVKNESGNVFVIQRGP